MPAPYLPVLVVGLVGFAFVFVTMLLSWVLRPKNPSVTKGKIYECGEEALGQAWANTRSRFYVIALIFLIFEVELAVMFPVGVVFREHILQSGDHLNLKPFVAIFIFAFTLFLGLIYSWVKGDLKWLKGLAPMSESSKAYHDSVMDRVLKEGPVRE